MTGWRLSRNLQTFLHSKTDRMQMSVRSVYHTATDPAGYDTVFIVVAVPLWIKNTSEKHCCRFCAGHLCMYRWSIYIHLCLCAYVSSFSLTSYEKRVRKKPQSERKRRGTVKGEGCKHAIWTNLSPQKRVYNNIIITGTRKSKQHIHA